MDQINVGTIVYFSLLVGFVWALFGMYKMFSDRDHRYLKALMLYLMMVIVGFFAYLVHKTISM